MESQNLVRVELYFLSSEARGENQGLQTRVLCSWFCDLVFFFFFPSLGVSFISELTSCGCAEGPGSNGHTVVATSSLKGSG